MNNPETSSFEEKITLATLMPEPSQEFASSLWKQIEGQPRKQRVSRPLIGQISFRPAWQAAFLILLAGLVIALLAIGPQRVMAQVQHWLGYVPGIGFVDLTETQVLASPVEATRDEVTLRAEQVIAGPDGTVILISSPGLTEEDIPWPSAALEHPNFTASLILPDGSQMEMTRWELNIGHSKIEFPALPDGVHQVTLLVPRLPLVPAGALPEGWEIPLALRPATGELADDLFPQPYRPPDASDVQHGITLRVLDVAQTSTETAMHYQVEWTDPSWEFRFGLGAGRIPELRDDMGHIYWESPDSNASSVSVVAVTVEEEAQSTPSPAVTNYAGTLVFPALSLSASQATLWVDALEFHVPAEGKFSLDLGESPQVGDRWSLDIHLEIAGFPVTLSGARLGEETVEYGDGRTEQRSFLEFDIDPLYEEDGFSLATFDLANTELGIYGQGGRSISGGVELYKGRITFITGSIPSGRIELQVTDAQLQASGPWEVSWNIPGRESGDTAPARLYPEITTQPDNKMQPVVEEVFLSDRLTAIEFSAQGLPDGVTFVQAIPYDPAAYDPTDPRVELYLQDNWGRRYEPGKNEAFLRPGGDDVGYDLHWRFFAPLEPLAQIVTLHIPGVEVLLAGEASFSVDVPKSLAFHEEEYTVQVIGGGGPEREETMTRMVSDPWAVDIKIVLAGYRLHFTQAQVEHNEHADPAYRLLLIGEPPSTGEAGYQVNSLRFTEVERPDGDISRIDPELQNRGRVSYPLGAVGPAEPGSKHLQAVIALDVTDANHADLLPGLYRVNLNGITVWVPGPWEYSWSLSRN